MNRPALDFDTTAGRVLAAMPDVRAELDAAHQAALASSDPRLLDLARARVAMLLGAEVDLPQADLAQWATSPGFSAAEKACLAFVEHYVIDVATVPDDLVGAVRDHLGDRGLANLVSALLVEEQRIRLELAWRGLGL